MAEKTFQCKLVTPAAQVLDEPVTYASIPAWDGLFGVQPNRAPIVAKLGLGELRLDFPDKGNAKGGSRSFLVDDGFVQMVNNRLTILAAVATPVESLSEADAASELAALERAAPADKASAARANKDKARARLKVRLAKRSKAI
ncbi:MAG: F0F1 ATP synthase subunit epsilon [Phycisphaerae bacterium]|nr:F0F1 ATP synthase subunit epsilon [Phycisphaerae bacterium]